MLQDLECELDNHVFSITLNRIDKHNAFDDTLLLALDQAIEKAEQEAAARVIVLKANGAHFSAGADVTWMQRMASATEADNIADAKILSRTLARLYHCTKTTIAIVQGGAFGGGAGLACACDIVFAGESTQFCFSEVKLGLIPAVISPYVIQAIGARAATWLFTSAVTLHANQAQQLQLVHHITSDDELTATAMHHAHRITQLAPGAVMAAKALVRDVAHRPLDDTLQDDTARLIAKQRLSIEGQKGMLAFINKTKPTWN